MQISSKFTLSPPWQVGLGLSGDYTGAVPNFYFYIFLITNRRHLRSFYNLLSIIVIRF